MSFVVWDEKLSVGIATIDEQHKKLLAIMNALGNEMRAHNGREALGKALNELVAYTKTHFRYEERLMGELAPKDLVLHVQEHQTLIARLNELKAKYEQSSTGMISIEALQFLRSWLLAHIAGSDKAVFREAAAKSRAGSLQRPAGPMRPDARP